jgi:centrosomal protein CEP76
VRPCAQVEVERKFFAYARAWWSQFIDLSPAHQQRPVKLFALSELGTQRPVSAFVRPSRASRLIETPAQAAHFVSLLAHRRDPAAGSSVADVWRTTHSTLATRGGETEEHALLLCSLLLGFGLDAFVCVGTDARGPHVWVLTRDAYGTVTFWESLSAQQYTLGGADGHPYHTLACVFSHAAFLANIQPSTHLAHISLDLDDRQAWKAMDPKVLQSVTPLPTAPLRPSASLEHSTAEVAAEAALQRLVDEHRASLGLRAQGVQWDEQLGHLLSPALYSYESQAVTGNPVGPDLFADAIKRYVPHGHTFKGFPQHFSAADAAQMFASWMASPIARDIVETRTLRGTLAVRVRVFPLTDDVTSVWAMLAIAYRPEAQQ